jgi:putative transposase
LNQIKKTTDDKNLKKHLEERIKIIQKERRDKMKAYPSQKNALVNDFETFAPKDVRSCAVKQCCDAFSSGMSNLRNGNIKFFNMKYKKKSSKTQVLEMSSKNISIVKGRVKILPETFDKECYLHVSNNSKKRLKNLQIKNNVDIVKTNNKYYLHISIETNKKKNVCKENIAGIDLGVRTFATVHSHGVTKENTKIVEYVHRRGLLTKLNTKIHVLKKRKKRVRKKQYTKIERKKKSIVDLLHWDFINDVLEDNDVIYLGDIKSHDIVKGGKNGRLNQEMNDLKFYQLKQRLKYKASMAGKVVYLVPEHHTTKTCSCCGKINDHVGSNEVFSCEDCKLVTGRDMNASKNMKMKGMIVS